MEKTDKSAAQDLAAKEWNDSFDYRSLRNGVQVGNIKMIHLDGVNERAMDIYAAQQLSEYKEVIKELLPIAERMQSACESGETLCYDNDLDLSDAKNYKSAIDRAKALLQGSTQGQPPQAGEQI